MYVDMYLTLFFNCIMENNKVTFYCRFKYGDTRWQFSVGIAASMKTRFDWFIILERELQFSVLEG